MWQREKKKKDRCKGERERKEREWGKKRVVWGLEPEAAIYSTCKRFQSCTHFIYIGMTAVSRPFKAKSNMRERERGGGVNPKNRLKIESYGLKVKNEVNL